MDRVGISFKAALTGDEVRQQFIRPLRAAVESAGAGIYSNYLRQGDDADDTPPEHLLVFQVRDFRAGLHLLRMELQQLNPPKEVLFHNLNASDPMY